MRKATSSDLPAILSLLEANSLPAAGVADHLEGFLVHEQDGELVAVGALENYGPAALLRSLAVREDQRGSGLGQSLTRQLLGQALHDGVKQVVLLTTTAATFFPRFGFRVVSRDEVPAAVKHSAEFTGACPASATVMFLDLEGVEIESLA